MRASLGLVYDRLDGRLILTNELLVIHSLGMEGLAFDFPDGLVELLLLPIHPRPEGADHAPRLQEEIVFLLVAEGHERFPGDGLHFAFVHEEMLTSSDMVFNIKKQGPIGCFSRRRPPPQIDACLRPDGQGGAPHDRLDAFGPRLHRPAGGREKVFPPLQLPRIKRVGIIFHEQHPQHRHARPAENAEAAGLRVADQPRQPPDAEPHVGGPRVKDRLRDVIQPYHSSPAPSSRRSASRPGR
jgi:hypothetical protein